MEVSGSQRRNEATARGLFSSLPYSLPSLHVALSPCTVAIQGFGTAGSFAARFLSDAGAKVVAISDVTGAYYNPDGININTAIATCERNKRWSLEGLENQLQVTKLKDPMKLLELDVDILIPAALEDQITEDNAPNVKARLIAECANGPLTVEADEILAKKGITIIPDILCNAGGVTVSYLEWVQNRIGYYWAEERILEDLKRIMTKAFGEVWETAEHYSVNMRVAAFILAIQRVTKAAELRGLYG